MNLNRKHKTYETFRKINRNKYQASEVRRRALKHNTKIAISKVKNKKLYFIKTTNFCTVKNPMRRMTGQATDGIKY